MKKGGESLRGREEAREGEIGGKATGIIFT